MSVRERGSVARVFMKRTKGTRWKKVLNNRPSSQCALHATAPHTDGIWRVFCLWIDLSVSYIGIFRLIESKRLWW